MSEFVSFLRYMGLFFAIVFVVGFVFFVIIHCVMSPSYYRRWRERRRQRALEVEEERTKNDRMELGNINRDEDLTANLALPPRASFPSEVMRGRIVTPGFGRAHVIDGEVIHDAIVVPELNGMETLMGSARQGGKVTTRWIRHKAKFDYEAVEDDEVDLKRGEVVNVVDFGAGFGAAKWKVKTSKREIGWVPNEYLAEY